MQGKDVLAEMVLDWERGITIPALQYICYDSLGKLIYFFVVIQSLRYIYWPCDISGEQI